MDSGNHREVREFLELCTYNEADWKAFLSMCVTAFEDSAAFRRSHPDQEKRRQFLPAYFKYLYEAELSEGRAGLACVKRQVGNFKPEIIYGLVGVYDGSPKNLVDQSEMARIDPVGMEIAIGEDEWIQHHVRDKMECLAKRLNFTLLYFPFQAARYVSEGTGTKYMNEAAELIGFDGIKRGKLPFQTPVVAYAVLDDMKSRRFYARVGMSEIAHYNLKENSCSQCSESGEDHPGDDCIIVAAKGYPDATFLKNELKCHFANNIPETGVLRGK